LECGDRGPVSVAQKTTVSTAMEIGIIGLGRMGSAIARNALEAGHRITTYNRPGKEAG
jgi:prephenate dehydrogenase